MRNGTSVKNKATTFIYQLIYTTSMAKKNTEHQTARSPTLDTVLMVERTIEKYSGEYTRTALWKRLPKQVMWQTYLVILDYLESINKIAFDKNDHVAYIWNPELAARLKERPEIRT